MAQVGALLEPPHPTAGDTFYLPSPDPVAGGRSDRLDPTPLSTPPLPHPVPFPSESSPALAWGSKERKKIDSGVFLGSPPSCTPSQRERGTSPGGLSRPQTYLEPWVRSWESCPLFPESGHHQQAAAPRLVLATATRPGRLGAESPQCSASADRTVAWQPAGLI